MTTIYTAHEAAEAAGVSVETLQRWFYSGRLRGHRTADNKPRIPRAHLISFLKENGLPLGELERTA